MFAYCGNNPVIREDHNGEFWDTVFDVVSLAVSAVEVLTNPTDLSAWAGLMGDAVDLVPFVTGVGETIRALKTADKITDGADTAIDTYRNLRRVNAGTGNEVHHIVEKRFADQLELDYTSTNNMLSVALSKTDHQAYTNAFRKLLPYGAKYGEQDVLRATAQVYADTPKLMGTVIFTLLRRK